ncbi:MAG: AmmeMemoRadiSam system protein B [Polyangiales bacterium]
MRLPAVAGTFYPKDPFVLRDTVETLLRGAPTGPLPKVIVVPHAGYVYSGPVAASAYARVLDFSRVVLFGPAHRVWVPGLATSSAEAFSTPLGPVKIDREAVHDLEKLPFVKPLDRAHAEEHSLEVQLPFLQVALGDFTLVPVAVGNATPEQVAQALDRVWGGPETLIVISSDLSHYLDDRRAKELDQRTCKAIEALAPEEIGEEQACGCVPLRGLLVDAKRRHMTVETLDLRNSGDISGKRDWVVGYGAWALR